MEDTHQPDQLPPSDEFQQAVAAAQNEASEHHWSEMSPREQTRAIYAQLRRGHSIQPKSVRSISGGREISQA